MISQTEHKLGFDRIRAMLAERCTNQLAVRMVEEMRFETDYDTLLPLLDQTDEMRRILMFESAFPSQDFIDLSPVLAHLHIQNTAIEQPELFDLRCSLSTIAACLRFFLPEDDEPPAYPTLSALAERVDFDPQVLKEAAKIIDDKGEIFDNASPDLLEIRRLMMRKRGEVDLQLTQALTRAKREGWAPENAEPTIRNGRTVIPMLDTHRRKIKGLIHDESATRHTAYLEPSEVVELNNDLRELEFAERHEIQRILMRFSDLLRPQLDTLLHAYWFLARIDFIRAKARLALLLQAGKPIVDNTTKLFWLDARHPLLFFNFHPIEKDKTAPRPTRSHEVIPFNITLNADQRILIVSGPNAGGKSVCLKAVGLIQYMLQCGLLVPCRETSEFGIFDRVAIDIGDEQSIDDDLSTYTSHLRNMKELLEVADGRTLFLLDELGGGTEPRSGCAIAEALLEELDRRGAFGVVTTHYADLKMLADHHPAIVNGAMLYDTKLMRPRYMLSIGHPGSSFAFEIAASVGFPQSILDAAGEKVGTEMLNFEHQLQQLELDKQILAKRQQELDASDAFLAEIIAKYQTLNADLETRKHEYLTKARAEAKQIVTDANRLVERTVQEIKEAQAEKEASAAARRRLQEQQEQLAQQQQSHDAQLRQCQAEASKHRRAAQSSPKEEEAVAQGPIVVGDIVRIGSKDTFGRVVELKGKKAVVESNSLNMTIALTELTKTLKKNIPVAKTIRTERRFQSVMSDINERRKYFNPSLDLRGMRVDEALDAVVKFIDEAQMLSEKELRIVHGKGFGILKQMIRQYLQSNHEVRSFCSERVELGGDGVTIVHLV